MAQPLQGVGASPALTFTTSDLNKATRALPHGLAADFLQPKYVPEGGSEYLTLNLHVAQGLP